MTVGISKKGAIATVIELSYIKTTNIGNFIVAMVLSVNQFIVFLFIFQSLIAFSVLRA